jgi:hypothetical protein
MAFGVAISVLLAGPAGGALDLDSPFGMSQIYPEYVSDAIEVGAKWLSNDIVWDLIEPAQDIWDWSVVDTAYYGFCLPNGFWQVLALRTGTGWATDSATIDSLGPRPPRADCPPRDYADFYDLVYKVVDHLKGTRTVFQVGVEPDIIYQWYGTAQQYLDLKETAYQAAKAANPEATILAYQLTTGGFGLCIAQDLYEQSDPQGAMDFFNGYFGRSDSNRIETVQELRSMIYGGTRGRCADMVRAYLDSATSCDAISFNFGAPYPYIERVLDWIEAKLDSGIGRKALWVLEWGIQDVYNQVSDEETAEELLKGYCFFFEGGLRRVRWYPLSVDSASSPRDRPRCPLINHGTGERLEGFFAYQTLAAAIGSRYLFDRRLPGSDPRIERFVFVDDATGLSNFEVVWCESCTVAASLIPPLPSSRARVRDYLGQEQGTYPIVGGFLRIELKPSPIFIDWIWLLATEEEPQTGFLPPPAGITAQPCPFQDEVGIRMSGVSIRDQEGLRLGIYNALGQRVSAVETRPSANGEQQASWDGRGPNGNRLPGGVYFCRGPAEAGLPAVRLVFLP